ncbi:MAG TPA: amino acid ABC transporter substrate-binding protein, partial [Lamprocystis sp. (in: g-proteobacteria)]|nr:amino acid ABC transporter substrate-binding protein [Lamprocystis sp. (in: g-proteobacteria)]
MTLTRLSLALIGCILLAGPALAEPTGTLQKIKDTNSITLGHRESSIPFSYYDDKQQVIGYSQDIA